MNHFFNLVLAVFVVLTAGVTLAHQPLWNDGSPTPQEAFLVAEPGVSKAIFGRLVAREVAYFRLEIPEDFKLDASLFVGGDCHETFQPEFWLMSADLPEGAPLAPEGYGARQIMSEWQPYQGHGLSGREGPEVREVLSAGVIYLAVVAPDVGGYYLVSLGGREAFGGSAEGREAIPKFNFCG